MTAGERAAKVVMDFHARRGWAYDPMQHAELQAAIANEIRQAEVQVRGILHEHALIAADMSGYGWTDCSTPLFQRVRNVLEELRRLRATEPVTSPAGG